MSDIGENKNMDGGHQANADDNLASQITALFENNKAEQSKRNELEEKDPKQNGDAYFFDEDGELCMQAGNLMSLIAQYESMQAQTLLDDAEREDLTNFANKNQETPVRPTHVVALIKQITSNAQVAKQAEGHHDGQLHTRRHSSSDEGSDYSSSEGGLFEEPCIKPTPWVRNGKSSDGKIEDEQTNSRRAEAGEETEAGTTRRRTPRKSKSRRRKRSSKGTGNESSMISNLSFRKPLPPAMARRKMEANAGLRISLENEGNQSNDSMQSLYLPSGVEVKRSFSYPYSSTPNRSSTRNLDLRNRIAEHRKAFANDSFDDSSALLSPSFSEYSPYSPDLKSPSYGYATRSNDLNWQSAQETHFGDSTFPYDHERISALESEVESLKRTISEKKRIIEDLQTDIYENACRFQKDVEDLQSDLRRKRKEEALNKHLEKNYLANIEDLENDLAIESKKLEKLRTQHAELIADHDQLASTLETETTNCREQRQTIKNLTADKANFIDSSIAKEKEWESLRDLMKEKIDQLQGELVTLQQELEDRESDKREIERLQEDLDQAISELNDARKLANNSLNHSASNSRQNTMSRRSLSHDLAKTIRQEREEYARKIAAQVAAAAANASAPASILDEDPDEPADISIGDLDASVDSETGRIMVAMQRGEITLSNYLEDLVPESSIAVLQSDERDPGRDDASGTVVDVVAGESSLQSSKEPGTLPTYDEAEVTKVVMERMHPRWNANSTHELQLETKGKAAKAYCHFAQSTGTRCREIEERLEHLVEPNMNQVEEVRKETLSDHLAKLINAVTESIRSSNMPGWLLVGIFLSWLTLFILLMMKFDIRSKAMEDAELWRSSNTLQVPWSIAGNFEHFSFQKAPFTFTWSERMFGKLVTPPMPF